MMLRNRVLSYLGFCPSKESAQDFRVRNNKITLKQKEYKEAIIGGIGGGIGGTIVLYILRREVPWAFLFTYPIFYAPANLYFNKRREAKKEEDVLGRGG
jgi:hypothetical protein